MKILILAYDSPPLISVGGQRPNSWAKYLPATGHRVTVVTRIWSGKESQAVDFVMPTAQSTIIENTDSGAKIIRTPFRPNLRDKLLLQFGMRRLSLVRKVLSLFYSLFEHLFFVFDAKAPIFYAALNEIKLNRPDIIIATGEPFILFKYGHILSKKTGVPWIADYRDNWTSNQGNYEQNFLQRLQAGFFRNRELKYIRNTAFITTASPTYGASLHKVHPGKKIEVVYNGYDDALFDKPESISPPTDKFIITYGGTIYPHQNLEMFLDGFQLFISANELKPGQAEVSFYGVDIQVEAQSRLLNYNLALRDYINAKGRLPYAELIKKMKASHILLLLSKKGADWLNAKVFDYLALKRPVLLVENDHGILESILKETNGGVGVNSKEEVAAYLQMAYNNFKQGLITEMQVNEKALQYTRKNQALVLSKLLKAN